MKVSKLPIHILCTSGRNVQDETNQTSLSKNGYDNLVHAPRIELERIMSSYHWSKKPKKWKELMELNGVKQQEKDCNNLVDAGAN